jgi:hypothetical protein
MDYKSNSRHFLQAGLAASTIPLIGQAGLADGIGIGTDRQLFLDDQLVDSEHTEGKQRSRSCLEV